MDAEQYCFEDFDYDEPEPSTTFDQSSDWDTSADVTLTEDRLKDAQAEETRTACKQLNHIKERQASIEKVTQEGIGETRSYMRLGGNGGSAFRSAKAAQRSSWAGSKSKAFFTHGRSRSWDFEDAGSGDAKGHKEHEVDNGFVRTGQGGTVKDAQAIKGILQNRAGAINQNQRSSNESNTKERTDLETIGEQRLQEDKFSVRTRNDVHHVRWKANALSTKHIYRSQPHIYNGGPKLVHSASEDSSLPPNQSSPIRPAGLIDRKDRYQSTMHGELHSQRTTDSFGPILQNRLPHQMKGQSLDNLPSAAERIRLFGPKDLIYDMNTQGTQHELSSRNSPLDLASSTDSGVSVSTTAESLEALEPEMARQLLLDIPPASLSPAVSKLKRKPIVLPSDYPDALDKALGLPPSGRLWDTQTVSDKVLGLPPSGRQVTSGDNLGPGELNELRARPASCHSPNNGHRPVTRSLTAPPSTGATEDGGKKILSKTGRSIVMAAPPIFSISSQGAAWRLEDEEGGYLPPTPSLEDTPFSQTSSQLYYPVPPRPTTPETERVRTSASNGGLAKLARRLSQRGERRGEKLPCRQRSVSVDSDYESDVASANGIPDRLWSMLLVDDHHATMPRKPSTGDVRKAHSMESLVPGDDRSKSSSIPPSPLAPNKLQRSLSGKKRGASMNEVDSTGLGGSSVKDKGRRNSKYISDLQALFEAVEHQDLDVAKYCLEANGLDLNQPNPDEFTVLDIAVMTNNMPMSRLLLSHGARENPRFLLKDVRLNKLNTLINEAEQVIQDLTTRVVNGSGNNNATSSSSIKDADRQLVDWEWRYRLLKRMKTGFEQARVPDIPALVRLYTASSSSLLVTFDEPLNMNGATATRFKIEWSQNEDFCPLAGEHILYHFSNLKYTIQGLTQGAKYYVRVSAFNMKGFGPAQTSNPPFAVPSCWRDVDGSKPRSWGRLSMIDELFQQVRDGRPADSVEIKSTSPRASPNQMRKTVRKSLKNLFQSAPKFQKHLRRGVYLASVIYNDDKVLVTTEDYLPIIEVDENFPSNVQQDFLWFMKVAQTWEDVDLLRTDLTQSTAASPVVHFRGRLLQAAAQLQSIMGMQDLGKLYYEPVKDSQGIVIFTLINCVKDPRTINNAALKWVSMTRVQKRKSMSVECPVAADLLLTSLPEKIIHHQVSSLPLTRGLYVGYLKLRSSLGNIRIQVPERHPSMLPHIKVRDNYNVSQEEWDWLHSLDKCEVKKKATRVQEDFQRQLASATRKLLTRVGVTEEEAITHRLCDLEVVELSSEVSFILLLPPLGSVCIGPGTPSDDWITSRDFTSISVPVFEMIHMSTYHGDFIRRYARLSSILDTESLITQQQLREAFSNDELNEAKRRQTQVEEFQKSLDMMWRGMRWIMDILQYARDKQIKGGVPLSVLYAPPPSPVDASEDILASFTECMKDPQNHSLLPPPPCSSIGCQTMLLPVERAADNTLKSGILRVFPAYNSGLAKGTSVKLHVTSKTSCEDIVSLVVQQLNKAMESSGMETPAFSPEDCAHFCLVAIIANKEYTLQEDFCPLQLQNPWTKGQLFVRPKDSERAVLNVGPSTAV